MHTKMKLPVGACGGQVTGLMFGYVQMLLLLEQLFLLSSIQKTKNELVLQDFRFHWFCVGNSAVLTHKYSCQGEDQLGCGLILLASSRTCLYWSMGGWQWRAQVDARFRPLFGSELGAFLERWTLGKNNLCVGINNMYRALERMPAKPAGTSLGGPQSKRSKSVDLIVTGLATLGQQLLPKRANSTPLQVVQMSLLSMVWLIVMFFSISCCCRALM